MDEDSFERRQRNYNSTPQGTKRSSSWDRNPKKLRNERERDHSSDERSGSNFKSREGKEEEFRGKDRDRSSFNDNSERGKTPNGRYNGRNFNRRRGVVRYVATPKICYDQVCKNVECQIPNAFVHHKDDCWRNSGSQQEQSQSKKKGFLRRVDGHSTNRRLKIESVKVDKVNTYKDALVGEKFAQKERKSKKEKITGLDEHLADRRRSQKHLCQQNSIRFHHNSITRTYNSSQGEKIHSIKTRSKIKYTDRKHDSNQVMNRKNDDDLFEAKCPEPSTHYDLKTHNRYELFNNEVDKDSEDPSLDIKKDQHNAYGSFDSIMSKLIEKFPDSIKNYFERMSEDFPNLTLPNPNSELGFVEARIGLCGPNFHMMADIGSTHSIISSEAWEKIPNKERYELAEEKTYFKSTTEGSLRGIKRVIVPFYMRDKNGFEHTACYCFYVIEGKLPHQAYLGRDWLQTSKFC